MRSSKELKSFVKSMAILLLVLHTLVLQSFTPTYGMCGRMNCSYPCFGIDQNTCSCLPAGCNGTSSTSTSTSSSTSGGGSSPTCNSNKNIICASGTPTCSNNRTAICGSRLGLTGSLSGPGCSGQGGFDPGAAFCSGASSSTSTTSSSTSGCIQCLLTPTCRSGEELIPATCTRCAYCRSTSSSTSTSSTSGGGSSPTCDNNKNIICASGTPTCRNNRTAICGSRLGFTGSLTGPGCYGYGSFDLGAASCASASSFRVDKSNKFSCESSNLCPSNRARFNPCREDKTICECSCSFKLENSRHTPRCHKIYDVADCPGRLTPTCSNPNNMPSCDNGILFCVDTDTLSIDLEDDVSCK